MKILACPQCGSNKVDMGNEIWNMTIGGTPFERGFSVDQTDDFGYIIMGHLSYGDVDVLLIKVAGELTNNLSIVYNEFPTNISLDVDRPPTTLGASVQDPDDDDIAEYIVDWGDDTGEEIIIGPFASGEKAFASHTWADEGTYVITAKAKDVNGLVGPEGTLTVTMPVNQQVINTLLQMILERFPNAFPILRYLLGL